MKTDRNPSTPLLRRNIACAMTAALFCMAVFTSSGYADRFDLHAPGIQFDQDAPIYSSWLVGDNYHDFNLYVFVQTNPFPAGPPDFAGKQCIRNFISVNNERQVQFDDLFTAGSPEYWGEPSAGDGGATSFLESGIGLNVTATTYLLDEGFEWIQYGFGNVMGWSNSWYWRVERTFTNESEESLHIQYYLYEKPLDGSGGALFSGRHLWYSTPYYEPVWLAWDAAHPDLKIDDYEISWGGDALYNDLMDSDPAKPPVDLAGGPYYPDEEYGSGLEMAVMFEFDLEPGQSYTLMFENARIPEPGTVMLLAPAVLGMGAILVRRKKLSQHRKKTEKRVIDGSGMLSVFIAGVLLAVLAAPAGAACMAHLEWVRTYDSPAHDWDDAYGVAVDSMGNICVIGKERRDDLGQYDNIWLRKYDTSGNVLWTETCDNPSHSHDKGSGIVLDASDNIYVTGYEFRPDLGEEYNVWLRKYDTNGATLWTKTYNSPANNWDEGYGVTVDAAGNVYVTGSELRSDLGQSRNIWLRKYDTNGNVLWTQTYDSDAHSNDEGYGVAVDAAGNVYVTGYEERPDLGQSANVCLRKYDTNGNALWTRTYDSPAHADDRGWETVVDGTGNVYVAGYERRDDLGQFYNIWLRKYDTNGNTLWTETYAGPSGGHDLGFGVTLDTEGYVYVTGQDGAADIWLRKYDANGNTVWTATYDSPGHTTDVGQGVDVDASGNVYVAGYEWRPDLGQSYNIVLLKYEQIPEPSTLLLLAPGLLGISGILLRRRKRKN